LQAIKNPEYTVCFVWHLILTTSCKFYYDAVTVMSFINIKYGGIAVKSIQ